MKSATALATALSFCCIGPAVANPPEVYKTKIENAMISVTDGDTFRWPGVGDIRLFGGDAPEKWQSSCVRDDGTTMAASSEAIAALEAILSSGTTILCIKQGDSYKRKVAYCEVDGKDVMATLIGHGLAIVDERYTSGTYEDILTVKQMDAETEDLGVHSCVDFETPMDYRARKKTR